MTTIENRYLAGNFAPVREELTVTDLEVDGALPPSLVGRLFRNGPNPIAPDPANYHWFLGNGMLHAIELRDGRAVSYRNRWVRTDSASELLGEPPIADQPDDVFIGGGNAANTHVVGHAGKILALVEVCLPTEVRADLSTVGRYDFGGALRSPMTAHPKMDPRTGEMVFFGYDITGPPWLRYHVVDASGALVRTEPITIGGPAMVHDFALTDTHVVWFDLPVVYDFSLLGQRPFPAEWKPEYPARVGVMPRDGGDADVRWVDVDPCYVYHPANAWNDGDRVIVDVPKYRRAFDHDLSGPADTDSVYERWTIDAAGGKVVTEVLDDRSQDFPRINETILGRRHRYTYTTSATVEESFELRGLVKHDHDTGRRETHSFGADGHAGEALFVPAPDATSEDDGWVLSVVYDATRDGSDLVVLDATDFAGRPVATVRLPQRVPFGFHGSWIPDSALG
jgi:carotenoid cleavage dioxygenase